MLKTTTGEELSLLQVKMITHHQIRQTPQKWAVKINFLRKNCCAGRCSNFFIYKKEVALHLHLHAVSFYMPYRLQVALVCFLHRIALLDLVGDLL